MNSETNYARRYHWLSEHVDSFVREPNNAVIGEKCQDFVLNMTAKESESNQKTCIDLVNDNPKHIIRDWAELTRHHSQRTLYNFGLPEHKHESVAFLNMPRSINWNKMREIYDFQPKNYEEFVALKGVGSNTVRSLALISDLIYGDKPSWSDPVKYSFAVGGKDGVPFPVDKEAMDKSTEIIRSGIERAKIGDKDKIHAIRRLHKFFLN